MYETLSAKFGWTPNQINELTLFQISYYLGGYTTEHGTVKLRGQALENYMAARQRRNNGV